MDAGFGLNTKRPRVAGFRVLCQDFGEKLLDLASTPIGRDTCSTSIAPLLILSKRFDRSGSRLCCSVTSTMSLGWT